MVVDLIQTWQAGTWPYKATGIGGSYDPNRNPPPMLADFLSYELKDWRETEYRLIFVPGVTNTFMVYVWSCAEAEGYSSSFEIYVNIRTLSDMFVLEDIYIGATPFDYSVYSGDPEQPLDPRAFRALLYGSIESHEHSYY